MYFYVLMNKDSIIIIIIIIIIISRFYCISYDCKIFDTEYLKLLWNRITYT